MSETLCTLRGAGGGGKKYTETSLWTNVSPSSNFSAQTITLSDNLSNYKYVAIRYKYSPSTSDTDYSTDILSVDDFKKCIYNPSVAHNSFALLVQAVNNNLYARTVFYDTDTSIQFTNYTQIGGTGSGVGNTIPLEILGLNELATGHKLDRTLLWTNNSPTTSMSTTSVTLSDDMTKYDYLAIKFRNSTTDATEYEDIMKVNDVISCAMFIGTVSTVYYVRRVNQLTDYYTLRFTGGMQPGTTATSNTACIPTAIYGCKLS